MNHIAHILLFTAPLFVISNSSYELQHKNANIFIPKALVVSNEKPKEFLPKSECNFDNSSNIASKKVKHFAYDCLQPNTNWLLIKSAEANYIDELR